MSDVFRTTTYRSGGDNILESIKGFFIGLVMFFAAFPILWWNEGCTDLSSVAKTAVVVKADGSGTDGEGKLVAVTAALAADAATGDPEMLAPGAYVELRRDVQMFAWVEHKSTTTEKRLGGGSKETTTYTYAREWTASPSSADGFEQPAGHRNPRLDVASQVFHPEEAKVGAFSFSPSEAGLPDAEPLAITADMVRLASHEAPAPTVTAAPSTKPAAGKGAPPKKPAAAPKGAPSAKASASASATATSTEEPPADDEEPARASGPFRFASGLLFRGAGTPEAPVVGDVKVTFRAVVPGKLVTLYGTRRGARVEPFLFEGKDKLYRVVPGTHEQAIAELHDEHQRLTWGVRIGGFFMMWIGLALIVGPFNAVLDIVPFFGSAGRFLTGLVMAPVAAILASVTIVIAILAHNPIVLAVTVALLVAGFVALVLRRRGQKRQAGSPVVAGGPGWGPPPGGPSDPGWGPPGPR